MRRKLWKLKKFDPRAPELAQIHGLSPFLVQVFLNRNICDNEFQSFIQPGFPSLYSPLNLPDMEKAADRIKTAVKNKEKMLIVGDYDVDGITSLSIFHEYIKDFPGLFSFYIPHRVKEGYGLNKEAVKKAKEQRAGLIVCFDCGTNNFEEIELADSCGIDTIVVDHHHPRENFNVPFAFINPQRKDCSYPFPDLSSGALSFKLLQVLKGSDCRQVLDLVALSVVCDVAPLKSENRILLHEGLQWIRKTPRLAIKALCDVSSIKQENIDIFHIGYILGPRINASGRIAHAHCALDLFLETDEEKVYDKARSLTELNKLRKNIESEILVQAEQSAARHSSQDNVLIVHGDGWHRGVLGIVASRLTDKYYKPTFVISFDKDYGRGSGRSIHSVHLMEVLDRCAGSLHMYGGHKKAAGIEIFRDDLDSFREQMNSVIKENLTPQDFIPVIEIDASMRFKDISINLVESLDSLKPFGEENPRPLFVTYNVSKKNLISKVNGNFSVWLDDNGIVYEGIIYDKDILPILDYGDNFDIVYCLEKNSYHNVPRLVIKDLRLAQD